MQDTEVVKLYKYRFEFKPSEFTVWVNAQHISKISLGCRAGKKSFFLLSL